VPNPDTKAIKKMQQPKKMKNLKSMTMKLGFKTGWSSYFDGVGTEQIFASWIRSFSAVANPIHLSFTFDKFQMSHNTLNALATVLPKFTNLRVFFLEILNMKLREFDMMVLAQGMVQCKQMEHLTLKYIDNQVIPMLDVFQFLVLMSKHAPFPKFDFFFRKLFYPEWHSPETRHKLDELENIQYVLTKQSIHVSKIQLINE